MTFEKAYCEYRLNRTNEALKTLDSADGSDDRICELRGQVVRKCTFLCLSFDEVCRLEAMLRILDDPLIPPSLPVIAPESTPLS